MTISLKNDQPEPVLVFLETDPSARTPRSRPRAGGGWAWPLPSREGVGDGWCSSAAEAVSQFPGPPLEDPPTSPPREIDGGLWGERGGTSGARAALMHSDAAAQRPMCQLVWRSGCSGGDRQDTQGGVF